MVGAGAHCHVRLGNLGLTEFRVLPEQTKLVSAGAEPPGSGPGHFLLPASLPSYLQETAASHHVEDFVFIFFILP